jgi:hypothetical protein
MPVGAARALPSVFTRTGEEAAENGARDVTACGLALSVRDRLDWITCRCSIADPNSGRNVPRKRASVMGYEQPEASDLPKPVTLSEVSSIPG